MKTQEIIWTALPNGWSGGDLLLSVHISPRLQDGVAGTTHTVNDYPDFLNWPANQVAYDVFLSRQSDPSGTPPRGPFRATVVTSPGSDSSLYTGLIKSGSFVQPRTFDSPLADQVQVRSYPVRHIRNFLKRVYTTVVTGHPTSLPSAQVLEGADVLAPVAFQDAGFGAGGEFGLTAAQVQALRDVRTTERGTNRANSYIPPGSDGVVGHQDLETDAFLQLQDFHVHRGGKDATGKDNPPVTIKKPTVRQSGVNAIDFHRLLSLAGAHPTLLRYLGFLVDLRFTPTGVTLGGSDWVVRVQPSIQTPFQIAPTNITPYTRLVFDASHFTAAPRVPDADIVDGGLAFDSADFEVIEIDHDGAAMKTLDLARYLVNLGNGKATDDSPLAHALASIRSGGLSVARVGAAQRLVDHTLKRASNLDAAAHSGTGTPTVLDAEDVTLGYAIHVFDSLTSRWHSLSRRVVTYDFVDLHVEKTVHDEATVQLAPTQSADVNHPSDLYQQETLFVWTGHSLAAQRPGKTLVNHPIIPPGSPPTARYDNTADEDFRVQIRAKCEPGSLPRLRFGATYQIRARAVDLAGNVAAFGAPAAPDPHATAPITYRRFEPVQAPLALLRKPRTEGESVERMVIRTRHLPDPADGIDQRHVSPPKTHEMMAETHGLFDTSTRLDPDAFRLIASLEDGSYLTSSQGTLDPNDTAETRYFDVDHVTVPFLPDPLARGVAFAGLPGTAPGSVFKVAFTDGSHPWPHYQAIRIDLAEGNAAPYTSDGGSVLHVFMPKGTMASVAYSCYVNAADLALMGIWNWLDSTTQGLHQADAIAGQVWALTPSRTLTLVHATKTPLFAPSFQGTPAVTRSIGQTFAALQGTLGFSQSSTSKLHVTATWPEPRDGGPDAPDDPSLPGNHPVTTAHAFDIPSNSILNATGDQVALAPSQHHFRDTRYRRVTYSAIGTTKFAEYFVERSTVVLTGVAPTLVDTDRQGFASGTVRVTALDGSGTVYRDGTDFTVDETGGTITRVATGSIPDGASVGVAYVEPPVTLQGGPVTIDIQSTARPAAPKVLYIVPAWQRTAVTSGQTRTVSRQGGSLRVYLDRPWWSSGDGELLGVVLDPGNGAGVEPDPLLAPYVTRWGQDPIFSSPAVSSNLPGLSAFPNRVVEASPALHNLAELPGPGAKQVYVAGHAVGFDTDRKLWYCDIDVDPGKTYFPFVRLALARYQPNSVADPVQGDLALSRVIVADFAQLTPNRSVTVTGTADPTTFQVSVVGNSFQAAREANSTAGQLPGPGSMSVWVEQRSSQYLGEFGWEVVPNSRLDNILAVPQPNGDTVWSAMVTIPNRRWPFRIVFEEYELLSQDDPANPGDANHPNLFRVGRRMVFSEIVPVTPDQIGILNAAPAAVAFGAVLVGSTSEEQTIMVSNQGTAVLSTGALQVTGPDAGRFTVTGDHVSNVTYQPADKRTVQVSFKATAPGNFSAQLQVPTPDGVGSPATVNLTATGAQPLSQITPPSLAFGSIAVRTRSAPQNVTLQNAGNSDLHIGTVASHGNASQFVVGAKLQGTTVPAGGSLTVPITFAPTSPGAKTAQLVVSTDSPNSPQTISMTGTGV